MEEADELIPEAAENLRKLNKNLQDGEAMRSLKRLLHTLKGSARMAGAMVAGELAHSMETRVESVDLGHGASGTLLDEVQKSFDRFTSLLDELRVGSAPANEGDEAAARIEQEADRAMLRVRAGTVDRLVNQAGEVSIARSRVQGEVRSLRGTLGDLTENIIRLRSQLREIEIQAEAQLQSSVARDAEAIFDPLEFDRFTRFQELTRAMAESVNDVATLQQALTKAIDQSEAALLAQARLSRELQDGLMAVRLVPFTTIAERLHRLVRQSSVELGKRVNLQIVGGHIELDRSVMERMTAPFEHLLRNAVIHGIEKPALRQQLGKDEAGMIRIELRHDGNEVHIGVADDGGGLDIDAIRRRALAVGLMSGSDDWPEQRLAELIFAPGFSTAEQVTMMAGRGVGMDVVKSEISALGGRIDLEFERGRGTLFVMHLPLTLGLKRSLLVEAGGRTYGLPLQTIEQVMTFKVDVIESLRQTRAAEWQGRRYPFHHLADLLQVPAAPLDPKRGTSVLMVRSGLERIALQVDRISGIQELVTKRLGVQLERLTGINGAAVLGTGKIVLLINPVELAGKILTADGDPLLAAQAASAARRQPLILVVDDSLTVRKVTGRLLTRSGYEVATAKDGVDALNQLETRMPDAMLVDIEMPRMDGFELTKHVRGASRWSQIPILMVTSRDAAKHRTYAFELGVNAFLGKPYQEEELLAQLERFLHPERSVQAA
ncbi:MAG: hypothetical protein C5B46_05105 [Proteobacteria bacterium]|nr:MAG: hypothetical protein C5B46_05105 [Pseudomonadota bacterium]